MKLKRIIAGLIAVAAVVPMMVIPSAAATITLTPTSGNKKYAINVTATIDTAEISFNTANIISLNAASIAGRTAGVLTSGSSTYNVKELTDTKFNNTKVTSDTITFGLSTSENRLPIGTIKSFKWEGTIVLNDSSKHPVNELGINLNDFSYNAAFTVYFDGGSESISFSVFKATVTDVSEASTFKKNTEIKIKDYINGGRGFTVNERESIMSGTDFKAVISLKDPVPAGGISLIEFSTDLYNTVPVREVMDAGEKSVTLRIPNSYIYNEELSKLYGEDFLFTSITLNGASEFTSIILSYTEGTAASTTTSAATTTGSTTSPTPGSTEEAAEDELFLNHSSLTLNVGASVILKASYSDVQWSKDRGNTNVTIYKSGRVLGVSPGKATITAKNASGDTVSCEVTVVNSDKPLTSYNLNTTKGTVYVDSSYSISKAQLSRTDHTDKINWTSSDTSIAAVNSKGVVTIYGVGKVTITATTSSGLVSSCVLTAKNPSLTLASSSATISINGTVTIKPTVKPSSSKVTYESLNEIVASVDKNGVVKGLSKGKADIQVTSNKGIVKKFTVTVN